MLAEVAVHVDLLVENLLTRMLHPWLSEDFALESLFVSLEISWMDEDSLYHSLDEDYCCVHLLNQEWCGAAESMTALIDEHGEQSQ
jgi:hypothetical protein